MNKGHALDTRHNDRFHQKINGTYIPVQLKKLNKDYLLFILPTPNPGN
jgi:hypothetical protein